MTIVNLTQHPATPEQKAAGVEDLPAPWRKELSDLLTVESLPTRQEIEDRCDAISHLIFQTEAENAPASVMIGGAPWMMGPLVRALRAQGVVRVLAAFSVRDSVEQVQPDGSVRKVNIFKHAGFVECD